MTITIDKIGNGFMRRPGPQQRLPPMMTGSHIDTQPTGGKFDGNYGVLAGLEVVRTLNDHGIQTEAPIEVAFWTNEEGSRFVPGDDGLGRVRQGLHARACLRREGHRAARRSRASSSASATSATRGAGQTTRSAPTSRPTSSRVPVLEDNGKTIGVVTGVLGIRWYDCTVTGMEAHAGPTPMALRKDALQVAAHHAGGGGHRAAPPAARPRHRRHGARAPEQPQRDPRPGEVLDRPAQRDRCAVRRHGRRDPRLRAAKLSRRERPADRDRAGVAVPGAALPHRLRRAWARAAAALGYSNMPAVSGAGHDAVYMARLAPAGMIFIPCKDGISHNEIEDAKPEHITAGCNVLLHAMLERAIRKIATGNEEGSARTIFASNILGMSCARVCPVEVLCVGDCVYNAKGEAPIQIGKLQRYATDVAFAKGTRFFEAGADTGKSVGLVGAGPASLAAAHRLRRFGHRVTIYEKRDVIGGLNTTGVAPHKLRADASLEEVEWVLGIGGIDIQTGVQVGMNVSLEDLEKKHDALFVGVGLGADTRLGVPGENLGNVEGAVAWIERMKLERLDLSSHRRCVVVGGGNTALDVVREARTLGLPNVTLLYRGDEPGMSGYSHEWEAAKVEGVVGEWRAQPIGFAANATGTVVSGIQCVRLDASKKPIAGSDFVVPADLVLVAIGQSTLGHVLASMPGVVVEKGGIVSPNPFWLASAPPANSGEQVHARLRRGLGRRGVEDARQPIQNVSSRFGGTRGRRARDGLQQHRAHHRPPARGELPRDLRGQEAYPKHAVIVSLMVETREEWKEIIKRSIDTGADGLELNFGCPHGMCERGMGSAVGQEPKVNQEITSWAVEYSTIPVLVKLTPNVSDIRPHGHGRQARRRARRVAHQHDQEHHRRRHRQLRARAARGRTSARTAATAAPP
jgi:NADPH-dependent glutamate synthase beta subunit-like oxidoreductase